MLQQNLIFMAGRNNLRLPFIRCVVVFVFIFFVVKPVPAPGFPVGSDSPVSSIRIDKWYFYLISLLYC